MPPFDQDNLRQVSAFRSPSAMGGRSPRQIGIHDREFTLFQVSGLLTSAMEQGTVSEGLTRGLNLDLRKSTWPAATVSYVEMRGVFEQLWLGGDRTQSIFSHASRINFASFGSVGLAAMALENGKEGIRFCARNFRAVWDAVLEDQSDGSTSMLHLPKFYDPEMRVVLELFHFVNCFAVSRSRAPGIPIASAVHFTGSCGVSQSALEAYFSCPVIIGADIAQIDFTREWIDRPLSVMDADVRQKLGKLCEDVLQDSLAQGRSALQFLAEHLDKIQSSDDMAHHLGVSRRTLGRMLEREGVSYSILSREVRLTQARRMLRRGDGIGDVAESLGFADERSFRRAFRSWSGSSPAEYRDSRRR